MAFKVKFPGGSQSLCLILRLGNLLWTLEVLQQWESFFGIIVLQFVGRLLSSSVMGLMVTSSKRAYATHCASQVCCSQSPCSHGRPLLTHASIGDTQTQVWLRCDYTKAFDCVDQNKLFSSVAQLCPTVCDPKDSSPPGSSVHGILQARIRQRVAIPFPRGDYRPRDKPWSPAL